MLMKEGDPKVILLSLRIEHFEQRKLDIALNYAKQLLKIEAGSDRMWILLARVLSAQKQFLDAETIINAALDQTCKWYQGQLLQTMKHIQDGFFMC